MEGMQTMTTNRRYFDNTAYLKRLANSVNYGKAQRTQTDFFREQSLDEKQKALDSQKRTAFKEYWNPADVRAEAAKEVAIAAQRAGEALKNSFPAKLRAAIQMPDREKNPAQTLAGEPHCAHDEVFRYPVRLADGSRGMVKVITTNFRAEITTKDGKPTIEQVKIGKTNEDRERVFYALVSRTDEQGRFVRMADDLHKGGVAFRLSGKGTDAEDMKRAMLEVRRSCCLLAGIDPAQKPAQQAQTQGQQSRAERIAAYEAQQGQRTAGPSSSLPTPAPSMGGRRAA